jgi:hypothetical protein
MKNIKLMSSLFIGCSFFYACDYVNKPLEKEPEVKVLNCGDAYKIKTVYGPATRKVLLEDYTGHECGNCPSAAIIASNLLLANPNNLIVLSVHAGYFAEINPAPFNADYNTNVGTTWDAFFGNSAAGNPNGLVNRKDFLTSTHIKNKSSWVAEVNAMIGLPAIAKINLTSKFDTVVNCLSVDAKTKFLQNSSANYAMILALMEDEVIGAQKDYTQNPNTVLNYTHKHMLRDALTASWGEQLNTNPVLVNDSNLTVVNNFTIKQDFDKDKLYVVAILYNKTTYEVIQTEKVKIK